MKVIEFLFLQVDIQVITVLLNLFSKVESKNNVLCRRCVFPANFIACYLETNR